MVSTGLRTEVDDVISDVRPRDILVGEGRTLSRVHSLIRSTEPGEEIGSFIIGQKRR